MDMIITRNSTRFRSLPVYTLTCGEYADCDSAHFFHRVTLTTTAKEDEDNGRNMLTSVGSAGDCKRADVLTKMSHQAQSSPNEENTCISRVQPMAGKSQIEITSRSCHKRERERERGHMRLARRGGHGWDDSNAFACLRSEKKLFVYNS